MLSSSASSSSPKIPVSSTPIDTEKKHAAEILLGQFADGYLNNPDEDKNTFDKKMLAVVGLDGLSQKDLYDNAINFLEKILLHANINTKNSNGKTALHYAAQQQNPTLFDWLIDQGADAEVIDNEGCTALERLAMALDTTVIKKSLSRPTTSSLLQGNGRILTESLATELLDQLSALNEQKHENKTLIETIKKELTDYMSAWAIYIHGCSIPQITNPSGLKHYANFSERLKQYYHLIKTIVQKHPDNINVKSSTHAIAFILQLCRFKTFASGKIPFMLNTNVKDNNTVLDCVSLGINNDIAYLVDTLSGKTNIAFRFKIASPANGLQIFPYNDFDNDPTQGLGLIYADQIRHFTRELTRTGIHSLIDILKVIRKHRSILADLQQSLEQASKIKTSSSSTSSSLPEKKSIPIKKKLDLSQSAKKDIKEIERTLDMSDPNYQHTCQQLGMWYENKGNDKSALKFYNLAGPEGEANATRLTTKINAEERQKRAQVKQEEKEREQRQNAQAAIAAKQTIKEEKKEYTPTFSTSASSTAATTKALTLDAMPPAKKDPVLTRRIRDLYDQSLELQRKSNALFSEEYLDESKPADCAKAKREEINKLVSAPIRTQKEYDTAKIQYNIFKRAVDELTTKQESTKRKNTLTKPVIPAKKTTTSLTLLPAMPKKSSAATTKGNVLSIETWGKPSEGIVLRDHQEKDVQHKDREEKNIPHKSIFTKLGKTRIRPKDTYRNNIQNLSAEQLNTHIQDQLNLLSGPASKSKIHYYVLSRLVLGLKELNRRELAKLNVKTQEREFKAVETYYNLYTDLRTQLSHSKLALSDNATLHAYQLALQKAATDIGTPTIEDLSHRVTPSTKTTTSSDAPLTAVVESKTTAKELMRPLSEVLNKLFADDMKTIESSDISDEKLLKQLITINLPNAWECHLRVKPLLASTGPDQNTSLIELKTWLSLCGSFYHPKRQNDWQAQQGKKLGDYVISSELTSFLETCNQIHRKMFHEVPDAPDYLVTKACALIEKLEKSLRVSTTLSSDSSTSKPSSSLRLGR